jgi:hypothetical protein
MPVTDLCTKACKTIVFDPENLIILGLFLRLYGLWQMACTSPDWSSCVAAGGRGGQARQVALDLGLHYSNQAPLTRSAAIST